jgi:hypothetical protein
MGMKGGLSQCSVHQLLPSVVSNDKVVLIVKAWHGEKRGTSDFPRYPEVASGNMDGLVSLLHTLTSPLCDEQ